MGEHVARPKVFIAAAVATTGPTPGIHSIVRLGVCVVGRPDQHHGFNFDPLTRGMQEARRFTLREMEDGLSELDVCDPRRQTLRFATWVEGVCYDKHFEPILVSDSPETWRFVQWYMQFVFGNSPFGPQGTQDVTALLEGMLRNAGPLDRAHELAVHLQPHLPYPRRAR